MEADGHVDRQGEALQTSQEQDSAVALADAQIDTSRNAFTALMSPKKVAKKSALAAHTVTRSDASAQTIFAGRYGLGAYIENPSSFPASRVIYHTDKFVAINDLYPKSFLHLLLLPRHSEYSLLHPFEAMKHPEFAAEVREEVLQLRKLAAKELKRRLGASSKSEQARNAAIDSHASSDWPEARDWEKDIMCGVHAVPSMSHLHVHVISVDRQNDCMRTKKHYNSFATPFLVDVKDLPLAETDPRNRPGHERYLDSDLICWRCKKNFGNRFAKLKSHLAEEYKSWAIE